VRPITAIAGARAHLCIDDARREAPVDIQEHLSLRRMSGRHLAGSFGVWALCVLVLAALAA